MKIDNFTPSTDLQSTHIDKTQQVEHSRSQRSGKAPAAKDSASISSLTQQISQALETESPERVAAVSEAQKLYQSGGFNVPAAEVADSLIQSAIADTALLTYAQDRPETPNPMPAAATPWEAFGAALTEAQRAAAEGRFGDFMTLGARLERSAASLPRPSAEELPALRQQLSDLVGVLSHIEAVRGALIGIRSEAAGPVRKRLVDQRG